jgi:flavodoxin
MINHKILIAFFSLKGDTYNIGMVEEGNTQILAKYIANYLKGDLYHIEGDNNYPEDHMDIVKQAKIEMKQNLRPKLINTLNNLQKQLKENSENYLIEKKNYLDKISDIEKNFEILSQEKNELNLTHAKEKNEYEKKITELMDILKEYEHENKEIGVNTDEYLLNQKLNDLYNKEKKKLEEDIIKYENMAKDKPYQCSICKKNFSLDVKLKEHMLEHTTIKSEEEMESDENKNIINNENKDNIEEIKEEIKNDKEETIDNNNINNNASTNNNNKIGLGFFGRIMAPIFLTESEINSINGQ